MTSDEKWLPVFGYEGHYEVSDQGNVRSLTRTVVFPDGRSRLAPGRVLRIQFSDIYPKVSLKLQGVSRTKNVHALVALAFHGPRPEGADVCHNDGDRQNNRADNLRYDTRSENNRDITRQGRRPALDPNCKNDHPLTGDNLSFNNGGRVCRICERVRSHQKYLRKKAAREESQR